MRDAERVGELFALRPLAQRSRVGVGKAQPHAKALAEVVDEAGQILQQADRRDGGEPAAGRLDGVWLLDLLRFERPREGPHEARADAPRVVSVEKGVEALLARPASRAS